MLELTVPPALVEDMLQIFDPNARGTFEDFRQMCDAILTRAPNVLLGALLGTPPPGLVFLSETDYRLPLIFFLAKQVAEPAVASILISSIMLPVSSQNRLERISRFEALRKAKFLEHLIDFMVTCESADFVSC
jgi:hypothetical protein